MSKVKKEKVEGLYLSYWQAAGAVPTHRRLNSAPG